MFNILRHNGYLTGISTAQKYSFYLFKIREAVILNPGYPYLPTPPPEQDMTQGRFFRGV